MRAFDGFLRVGAHVVFVVRVGLLTRAYLLRYRNQVRPAALFARQQRGGVVDGQRRGLFLGLLADGLSFGLGDGGQERLVGACVEVALVGELRAFVLIGTALERSCVRAEYSWCAA